MMKGLVVFLILIPAIINKIHATRLGHIRNGSYATNDTTLLLKFVNTCSECICEAFFFKIPPMYIGLNCYQSRKICELVVNYSTSSMITMNNDSMFIFLQLPPLQNKTTAVPSLLDGITVAGYGNGTPGNTNDSLRNPWGLMINEDESFYVADFNNYRVMKIGSGSKTGSKVAGTGISGTMNEQLRNPAEIHVDAYLNIYVNDNFNNRVMLWRWNASLAVVVVGDGTGRNSMNTIGESIGLAVDLHGNIYVSDKQYDRVVKWSPNVTSGIVIAGTGVGGASQQQLFKPHGLFLDELNSHLYIADTFNHRIQRYHLGNVTDAITAAGGNGPGNGPHQLNQPYDVCVSKKTGDIYIADKVNHRIQRWSLGATSGITIIGITGTIGTNATMLSSPSNVALNKNETYLYVSDMDNHRVQQYKLV